MENNDDGESAIMIMRKFVIKSINECDDMEVLDLIYRILKVEGRADQPCLVNFIKFIRLYNPKRQDNQNSSNQNSICLAEMLSRSKL